MITNPVSGQPTVVVQNRLQVIGGRALLVPGCEPTSAITSVALMRQIQGVCRNSIVDVAAALLAIPGSTLEFGQNFGGDYGRQTWFVLPPSPYGCCDAYREDWYKTLRELPPLPVETEDRFNYCNTFGMGFCPSGDFKLGEPAPATPFTMAPSTQPGGNLYGGDGPAMPSTYVPEGTDIISKFYNPREQPTTGLSVDLPT